jgi:thiosulfate/3-mercaptopyruvate sulfurtransferase
VDVDREPRQGGGTLIASGGSPWERRETIMRRALAAVAPLVAMLLAVGVAPALADGVITAKELAEIMDDDTLRIISARQPEDYKKVHIKGAVSVWHKDLYQDGEVKGLLKSPEEMAELFGAAGVGPDNAIVIYDDGKGKFSGRLYWILRYLGAEDVSILDGHMKMWRKARKPVTKEVPEFDAAVFTPSPNEAMIATAGDVGAEDVLLVDVRSKDEYDGKTGESERKGHIPGAIWFDYANVINEDGTFKPKDELSTLLNEAGITPENNIVLYCETSVRAGIVYLVLDELLEYPNVRVYDGAYQEWAADPSNPVE